MYAASSTAVVSQNRALQIEGANFLNLLIVDDDHTIREASREVARSLGFNPQVAETAEQAYRLLDSNSTDVVLLDLRPSAGGLEALHTIKKHRPDAVVIMVTGQGTVQSAVQAMKNGAFDYVTKPFSMEELRQLLGQVAAHLRQKTENRRLREAIKSRQGFGNIIGRAQEMEKIYCGQGRTELASGADSGRERHGQGVGGQVDPLYRQFPYQAVYSGRLRIAGADVD